MDLLENAIKTSKALENVTKQRQDVDIGQLTTNRCLVWRIPLPALEANLYGPIPLPRIALIAPTPLGTFRP